VKIALNVIEILVNAFWSIALPWDLNVFWNKLHIWGYPLCWNPNGRAIDQKALHLPKPR